MRAPDLAEAIGGWRVWVVRATRNGLRLGSVLREDVWLPGEPLRARRGEHVAPRLRCTCGIYAAHARAKALPYLLGRDERDVVHRVLGTVSLWGRVVEAEDGWCAQLAYPRRLRVPPLRRLRVALDELLDAMLAYRVPMELAGLSEVARR